MSPDIEPIQKLDRQILATACGPDAIKKLCILEVRIFAEDYSPGSSKQVGPGRKAAGEAYTGAQDERHRFPGS